MNTYSSFFVGGKSLDHVDDYKSEFNLRRSRGKSVPIDSLPKTAMAAYVQCSENFPITKLLLQIYGTLPVPSVTAEGKFTSQNFIESYKRATMSSERLNGLAKLHIH